MKVSCKTLILIFFAAFAYAQEPFITTWEVTNTDLNIYIPTDTLSNYTIDFGDGTVLTNVTGSISHDYQNAGTYTVSINGGFRSIRFQSYEATPLKIKSIEQWGDIEWESMEDAFYECSNLVVNAIDAPDLSQVFSTRRMFYRCYNFNQSVNHWDVSNVTDMSLMFEDCFDFNQPLNTWDVSNVTNMLRMFYKTSFNQPLNNWNVSNVTNMSSMFWSVNSFNQPIGNWNVSNVTNMGYMFAGCRNFNQPLNNWDVSNVTDMTVMFSQADLFNQPLNNWDVSSVTSMVRMFYGSDLFNQNIDSWNVSNVTTMYAMFSNALSFNQPLSSWNVSSVTEMGYLFENCYVFDQPLDNWNVSNVTNMSGMFENCYAFDQPLSSWNVSNVINMNNMFEYCYMFNQPLDSWDFSSINYLTSFISNTALNVTNYDNLLSQLASSALENLNIGVSGLEYCNVEARDVLLSQGCTLIGDALSSECSNLVTGMVYYDSDNNGCTNTDLAASNYFVQSNSGSSYTSTVVQDGAYEIYLYSGANHTISLANIPNYFTVNPESSEIDFSTSSTQISDFCLTANQTVEDLNITLLPIGIARPGFQSYYKLVIENIGTETINNVTASVIFDDIKQSFVSAMPSPTSTSSNSLDFSLGTINPFQILEVALTMQTLTPPTVNLGDILNFTATVLPVANDNTPDDNTFTLIQTVINAYDPNDKRVLQGEEITTDQADDYLDYIIRFQNAGNANATFVRIKDELDQDLDWSTIKMVSASHDYKVTINNRSKIEFLFENINLPYEAADEPNSHGYIAYKIKPKNTIEIGDIMSGNASIYFDYNLPIVTNTVATEVINNLSVDDFSLKNLISVYPNPTDLGVFINTKDGIMVSSVTCHNLQGTQLFNVDRNLEFINTNEIAAGIYILTIDTNKGKVIKKLIIE